MPTPQRYTREHLKEALKSEAIEDLRKMLVNLAHEPNIQLRLLTPEQLNFLSSIQIERPPYSFPDKLQNITLPFFGAVGITPGLPTLINTVINAINTIVGLTIIALLPAVWWAPLIFLGVTMTLAGINVFIKQKLVNQQEKVKEQTDKLLALKHCIGEVLEQKLKTLKYQKKLIEKAREISAAVYRKLGRPVPPFEIENWRELSTSELIEQIQQMLRNTMLQGEPGWGPMFEAIIHEFRIETIEIETTEEGEVIEEQLLIPRRLRPQRAPRRRARRGPLHEALGQFKNAPPRNIMQLQPSTPLSGWKKWYPEIINAIGTALGVASIAIMFFFLSHWLAVLGIPIFLGVFGTQLYLHHRSQRRETERNAAQSALKMEIANFERSLIKHSKLEESGYVAAHLTKQNYQRLMDLLGQLADTVEALPTKVQVIPPRVAPLPPPPTQVQVVPPRVAPLPPPPGAAYQFIQVARRWLGTMWGVSRRPTGAAETRSSEVQDPPRAEAQQPAPLPTGLA